MCVCSNLNKYVLTINVISIIGKVSIYSSKTGQQVAQLNIPAGINQFWIKFVKHEMLVVLILKECKHAINTI